MRTAALMEVPVRQQKKPETIQSFFKLRIAILESCAQYNQIALLTSSARSSYISSIALSQSVLDSSCLLTSKADYAGLLCSKKGSPII
jgi:hypothetical protein